MSAVKGSLREGPNVTTTRSSPSVVRVLASGGQLELPQLTMANVSPPSIRVAKGPSLIVSISRPSGRPGVTDWGVPVLPHAATRNAVHSNPGGDEAAHVVITIPSWTDPTYATHIVTSCRPRIGWPPDSGAVGSQLGELPRSRSAHRNRAALWRPRVLDDVTSLALAGAACNVRGVDRSVANPEGRLMMRSDDDREPPLVVPFLLVAPEDAWGVRCSQCDRWHPRPRAVNDDMNVCDEDRAGLRREFLAVIADDVALVERQDAVWGREWWHASASRDIDLTRADIMHWGSKEAAMERAHSRLSPLVSFGERMYLHRATVRPGVSVHPDVMLERPGEGTDHRHGERLLLAHDVVRYVNGTEGPGAVSLMLRPSSLLRVAREAELIAPSGTTVIAR